ncbi:MAG TPA: glycosyltransferase family 1 protein [Sphingomicrobium sp.]
MTRPLRIALFSGNYNYLREGANQSLNRLVGYLEGAGHRVRVYSPVTDTPAFPPQGTLIPVPSIPLPIRSEFRLALGIPPAVRRDIERFAPDLIHVSVPDILNTRAETWAEQRNVPIVASLHTRFETYPAYYPGLRWLAPLAEVQQRRFYRRANCVLVPNPALVEEMAKLRGDDRVALWSRGVDRELFNPARRDMDWRRAQGWSDDDTAVLFFGRLVLEKGIDTYVEAVRSLRRRGLQVRPLIVGAGPAADRFGALEGATFTGHLDGSDLARAVASADIMLSPSTTEAFGNVVLEAMASGVAVVSADAPSASALIDDGRNGILCANGPSDYVAAVERLMQAPGERRRIASAARAASAAFSWDAASGAVEAAYRRTLAAHQAGGAADRARKLSSAHDPGPAKIK